MLSIPEFTLPELNPSKKKRLLAIASQILQAQQHMSAKNKNILHYTLQKKKRHIGMNHYPKGDRIDHQTGAQYFYHCHRENLDSMEHGHFHCFMRHNNIPAYIKPILLPDEENDSPMTHLVAIAMNRYGQPIRLFTVNRWISYDIWYDAKHTPKFIKRFKMTLNDDPWWQVLDQWVEGMMHLFAPQIAWLQLARDDTIHHHQKQHPHINAYKDENLEELSSIAIDLNQQIQWLLA